MKKRLLFLLPILMLACNVWAPEPAPYPTLGFNNTPENTLLELAMTSTAQSAEATGTSQAISATAEYLVENPPSTVVPTNAPASETPLITATTELLGMTMVRAKRSGGGLISQIEAMAKEARLQEKIPVVYFNSRECKPCKTIRRGLDEKNPNMLKAFDNLYILEVDVEQWGWDWARRGFIFQDIPMFFVVDYTGKPSDEKLNGSSWELKTTDEIAVLLDEFFHDPENK